MIALAVVAAQYAGTFDATVTARGDARVNDPANQISVGGRAEEIAIAADGSLAATALLRVRDRFWDFTLGYSPSILVPDLELQVDRDVNPSVDPTVLSAGNAGIRWHDKYSWFAITESGAYGYVSTTVPYTGAPTTTPEQTSGTTQMPSPGMTPATGATGTMPTMGMTTMTLPTTQTTLFNNQNRPEDVQYAAWSNGLAIGTMFGRRTTAIVSGSYSLSGGIGSNTFVTPVPYFLPGGLTTSVLPTNTLIIPYTQGPSGSLTITTRLSRTEALFTTASGNDTYFNGDTALGLFPGSVQDAAIHEAVQECIAAATTPKVMMLCPTAQPVAYLPRSSRSDVVQLEEGYRRQLARNSLLSVSVGVAGIYGPVENGGYSLGIAPVLTLNYTEPLDTAWPGTLVVTVNVAPTVDLLTSIVSDIATASATLNARVTRKLTVAFGLTAMQSLPIPQNDSPTTSLGGSIEARFRLNRQADVIVGDQEYWQDQIYGGVAGQPDQSFTTFISLAYVGVTLRAPTLHF
jgi:hypothetical protein